MGILINLPNAVEYILNKLNKQGFEAYIVGGAVRDSLLGKTPKDWDIVTSALPHQIEGLFEHTIPVGKQFGVITAIINEQQFEIATFRQDGVYLDGRHPESITYTTSIAQDLARRDFTINAICYNPNSGIIDPFDGQEDLKNKIIKCVGNPYERFNEDALRMMRCIRFGAQLNFGVETDTLTALRRSSGKLKNVSNERIRDELNKILLSEEPIIYLNALYIHRLTDVFIPEYNICYETEQHNPYHEFSVGVHSTHAVGFAPNDLIVRLALYLHDIGKPAKKVFGEDGIAHYYGHWEESAKIARAILQRLRYDNETVETVCTLILYHDVTIHGEGKAIRKWLGKLGEENFKRLIQVKYADAKAHSQETVNELVSKVSEIEVALNEELLKKNCVTLKDLKINGNDLKELGIPQGKFIGEILKDCLEMVIEDPSKNTKPELLYFIYNGYFH